LVQFFIQASDRRSAPVYLRPLVVLPGPDIFGVFLLLLEPTTLAGAYWADAYTRRDSPIPTLDSRGIWLKT
jgi:hypothetical protein